MTQAALSLSLARIISQGLVEETAADDPIAAVDNMLALQAQLPSSIPWAINLRVKQPSVNAIDEAFESAELVRSWPMRGTIHVTSAKDHHWLRQVLRHRYRAWMRSFEEEGLPRRDLKAVKNSARPGSRKGSERVRVRNARQPCERGRRGLSLTAVIFSLHCILRVS